jgi:hypothetical protein
MSLRPGNSLRSGWQWDSRASSLTRSESGPASALAILRSLPEGEIASPCSEGKARRPAPNLNVPLRYVSKFSR